MVGSIRHFLSLCLWSVFMHRNRLDPKVSVSVVFVVAMFMSIMDSTSGHGYAVSHVSTIATCASLARPHFCDDTRTCNRPGAWGLACDPVVVALGFLRECANWDRGMFVRPHFSIRA